ncbi:MAG TPA: hypothetical protein VH309_10540 [Elusimicrobiota bacterium]|jgi:hypothetical protein|nr:hypothetical protein [Elusimicrobiota bacterium]
MKKILFAFFLAIAATAARADTVILKGGGRLEGTVVRATKLEVLLDTSQGRVSIDADRVQSIDYGKDQALTPVPVPPPYEYRMASRRGPEPLFEAPSQSLSIDFGLAAPLSGVNFSAEGGGTANDGDVGPLIGLQYLYFAAPRVGLGLEVNDYNRSRTDSPNLWPNAFAHVSGDSVLLMGNVKLALTDQGSVRPYLLLAGGAHRTTTTVDVQPIPGFVWNDTGTNEPRRVVDGAAWGPALSVRLGLDFGFVNPGVFALEAGWTGLMNASYQATGQGQALGLSGGSGTLNYFTLAGRWGWSF